MELLIKVFHILISIVLIFIVLLQSGKGAEMGAAFGGSSSSRTLFGATGANTFMTKLTTFVATLFIITCLVLAYRASHMATVSVMSDVEAEAPPVTIPAETMPQGVTLPPIEGDVPSSEMPPPAEGGDAQENH